MESECRAAVQDLQGMLKRSESRKALGYFLDEFWPSTPVETKALDHILERSQFQAATQKLSEWSTGSSVMN